VKARPGILKHRITVQANGPTASDYGENTESWYDTESVWASIRPMSSSESFRAGQATGKVLHEILVRYRADGHDVLNLVAGGYLALVAGGALTLVDEVAFLTPKHRLTFGTRTFEVLGVSTINEGLNYTRVIASEVIS
jgi:head-tail adaptor